jgi:hypothetical protein
MKKCHRLPFLALAAIAVWAAMNPGAANAGSVVYVAGSGNEFGTLNLTTGAFTDIGTLNLPTNDNIFGMGFGSNGALYGLDATLPTANLYQINITNADATLIGPTNPPESAIDASADASGKLYALSQDTNAIFYSMTPATTGTTTTVVGPTGISSTGLMAVNASGTQIFTGAYDPTTGTYDLYSINPTTGVATLIGDTGFYIINGLFVNGTLYGFDDVTNAIVTINTTTGIATQVATYNLPGGDNVFASALLTTTSVPEPSSVVLGLIGVAAVGSTGLLRRRSAAPAA